MLAALAALLAPAAGWAQSLVAAVLPTSRAVPVGVPATAFASIINNGAQTAVGCRIEPVTAVPGDFLYQTTNAANQLTGTANTPVDVAPGQVQSFLFVFTPAAPFGPQEVQLRFVCDNAAPAPSVSGLNTLQLLATTDPGPDIIAIAATLSDQAVTVDVPDDVGGGAFAVATANVGTGGTITATADAGGLPVTLAICQTDAATGGCLAPPQGSVTAAIAGGVTSSFAVFVTPTGEVPDDPANHRIRVLFTDADGLLRGSTSVAVRTVEAACPDVGAAGELGVMTVNLLFSEIDDRDARFARIADFAVANRVAVLLLQEATGGLLVDTDNSAEDLQELLRRRGVDYQLSYNRVNDFPGVEIGNAILSRCRIAATAAMSLPEAMEIPFDGSDLDIGSVSTDREVMLARIVIPGREAVDLFNTHLCSNCGAAQRLAQAQVLVDFVASTQASAGARPAILGGDFNTNIATSGDFVAPVYDAVTSAGFTDSYAAAVAGTDAFCVEGVDLAGCTLGVSNIEDPLSSLFQDPEPERLDFVFTRGLEVLDSQVVFNPAADSASLPGVSDHSAVVTTVRLP